jgi:hypothetical protein
MRSIEYLSLFPIKMKYRSSDIILIFPGVNRTSILAKVSTAGSIKPPHFSLGSHQIGFYRKIKRLPPVGFANAKIDRTFIVISHKNEMSIWSICAASVNRLVFRIGLIEFIDMIFSPLVKHRQGIDKRFPQRS